MHQILFEIPFLGIPIHGYGFMLFVAFVACLVVGLRLCKAQGIPSEVGQDLAIWLFIPGLIGARLLFVLTELNHFIQYPWRPFTAGIYIPSVLAVGDGGLVFYGSAIGGVVGFVLAYFRLLKPRNISAWKMADILAPCIVLGLAIGRVGCLLNGCCYGHVATLDTPAVYFPMPTDPRKVLTARGLQTTAGFLVEPQTLQVSAVELGSAADHAGLREGDVITAVNGKAVVRYYGENRDDIQLEERLTTEWPRGEKALRLSVERAGQTVHLTFVPWTLGLHPTQIYETVSAGLLTFLLLAYLPLRRRNGELIALLMIGYAVHRFLNEAIRNDTGDVAFGLTLSQNISIVLLLAGIGLLVWLWRQPVQYGPGAVPAEGPAPARQKKTDSSETALHE